MIAPTHSDNTTELTEFRSVDEVVATYRRLMPSYNAFATKMSALIEDLIASSSIEIIQVDKRCKSAESLEEKISRPGKAYLDPLREITDLAGIRIITYYLEDAERICEIIRNEFDVDEENSESKSYIHEPEQFGYRSFHLAVRLDSGRSGLTEWKSFGDFSAEVQVRTALQHAWAAISHKLQYKSTEEVPSVQRRKLSRLSALLELADEQFSELRDDTLSLAIEYQQEVESGNLDIELNLVALLEYVQSPIASELENLAVKAGWTQVMDIAKQTLGVDIDLTSIPGFADRMTKFLSEYTERRIRGNYRGIIGSGFSSISEMDYLVQTNKSSIGKVLTQIWKECKAIGFTPYANPIDVLTILVWYAKRDVLKSSIVDTVTDWNEVGRAVAKSVIFGDDVERDRLVVDRATQVVDEGVEIGGETVK